MILAEEFKDAEELLAFKVLNNEEKIGKKNFELLFNLLEKRVSNLDYIEDNALYLLKRYASQSKRIVFLPEDFKALKQNPLQLRDLNPDTYPEIDFIEFLKEVFSNFLELKATISLQEKVLGFLMNANNELHESILEARQELRKDSGEGITIIKKKKKKKEKIKFLKSLKEKKKPIAMNEFLEEGGDELETEKDDDESGEEIEEEEFEEEKEEEA